MRGREAAGRMEGVGEKGGKGRGKKREKRRGDRRGREEGSHFSSHTNPFPHSPTPSHPHSSTQYPVLTLGDDLGSRVVLYEGHSPVSGGYVVEECEGGGGETVRRLIFTSTPHLAQTEVRMVQGGRVGGCGGVVSVSV